MLPRRLFHWTWHCGKSGYKPQGSVGIARCHAANTVHGGLNLGHLSKYICQPRANTGICTPIQYWQQSAVTPK